MADVLGLAARETVGNLEERADFTPRGDTKEAILILLGYRDEQTFLAAVNASEFPDLSEVRARSRQMILSSMRAFTKLLPMEQGGILSKLTEQEVKALATSFAIELQKWMTGGGGGGGGAADQKKRKNPKAGQG